MPAHSLLFAALCATSPLPSEPPLPIGSNAPSLTISLEPFVVRFHVSGPESPFIGAVIGSLSGDLVHYFNGLPPLLADFVVLDIGFGDGPAGYTAILPESLFPPGVLIHAQGVTLADGELLSTEPGEFVLDVTVPEQGSASR